MGVVKPAFLQSLRNDFSSKFGEPTVTTNVSTLLFFGLGFPLYATLDALIVLLKSTKAVAFFTVLFFNNFPLSLLQYTVSLS